MAGRGGAGALLRLAAAALAALALVVGMLALFVAETFTTPLFGGSVRDAPGAGLDAGVGAFQVANALGLWLANPAYLPLENANVHQLAYFGVLPALLLAASRPAALNRSLRAVRPVVLSTVAAALATLAAFGGHAATGAAPAATILALVLALAVFPTTFRRWACVDVALGLASLAAIAAAAAGPIGDALRAHVPPFTLMRWNYLYLWLPCLALPLLAWRTAEQLAAHAPALPPPGLARLTRWREAWVPALAILVAVSLVAWAVSRPPGGPPGDVDADFAGTLDLAWAAALLLAWSAGAAACGLWRHPHAPAACTGGGALLALGGALVAGRLLAHDEALVRAFTPLPPGGRHLLDVAQQALVAGALAMVALRARTWPGLLRGAAIVAVFDLSLASARYLTTTDMAISGQTRAHVTPAPAFDFASAQRHVVRPTSPHYRLEVLLGKSATLTAWPGYQPQVDTLDQQAGEPSVFASLSYFPPFWRPGESGTDVAVGPEQLRALADGRPVSPPADLAAAQRPRCPLGDQPAPAAATVTRLLASEVRLRVAADCERLLVFMDSWAPGWRVAVDGRAIQPLRVDHAVRGAIVPAGEHEVTWTYRPRHLAALLVTMGASLGAAVLLALAPRRLPLPARVRSAVRRRPARALASPRVLAP